MSGTLTRGYTFGATEEVTAAKLHALVDDGLVSGITADEIASGVITDDKISSVSGSKFITLSGIPAGAGDIPKVNLDGDWDTDGTLAANSDVKIPTQKAVKTYAIANPSSGARGDILYHNGTNYVRLAKGTEGQYLKIGANDPAWAAGASFGAWASKSNNTVYQADTDGIICATALAATRSDVIGLTDGSNPPTTQRAVDGDIPNNEGDKRRPRSITFPVKKNDYYKVTGADAVYWISLG